VKGIGSRIPLSFGLCVFVVQLRLLRSTAPALTSITGLVQVLLLAGKLPRQKPPPAASALTQPPAAAAPQRPEPRLPGHPPTSPHNPLWSRHFRIGHSAFILHPSALFLPPPPRVSTVLPQCIPSVSPVLSPCGSGKLLWLRHFCRNFCTFHFWCRILGTSHHQARRKQGATRAQARTKPPSSHLRAFHTVTAIYVWP
jgi:hypothetical protein